MAMKINNEWLQDFEEFMNAESVPPQDLSSKVLNKTNALMNPSSFLVFAKLMAIHLIVGTLSLAICHQFDLNPFNTDFSLADWFMKMGGHRLCMSFCGVFFIGTTMLASGAFLSIEESKSLKNHKILQTVSLCLVSILFLILFGAEVTLAIAAFWFAGGLLSGLLAAETVWLFKKPSTR
jgi:hypothetical protein